VGIAFLAAESKIAISLACFSLQASSSPSGGSRCRAGGMQGSLLPAGVSLQLVAFPGDSPGNPPAAHELEPAGAGGAGAGREVRNACKPDPGTHRQSRLPAGLGVQDGRSFPRSPVLTPSLRVPVSPQARGRGGTGGGSGRESAACLQRQLAAPAELAGGERHAGGAARAGGRVRGWQKWGSGSKEGDGRAP